MSEMNGLELIECIANSSDKGKYYWNLDMKGIFLESMWYENKQKALHALVSNNIHWDSININSDRLNSVHNK